MEREIIIVPVKLRCSHQLLGIDQQLAETPGDQELTPSLTGEWNVCWKLKPCRKEAELSIMLLCIPFQAFPVELQETFDPINGSERDKNSRTGGFIVLLASRATSTGLSREYQPRSIPPLLLIIMLRPRNGAAAPLPREQRRGQNSPISAQAAPRRGPKTANQSVWMAPVWPKARMAARVHTRCSSGSHLVRVGGERARCFSSDCAPSRRHMIHGR